MFTEKELKYLEEILNEEIYSYLKGGDELTDEYVISLRNILNKLEIKEIYNYDEMFKG